MTAPRPSSPTIKVLLFASLRELAGAASVSAEGSTVRELVEGVCAAQGGDFVEVVRRSAVAVDGETIPEDHWDALVLTGSEEVAILPPVSGGGDTEGDGPIPAAVLTVSDRSSAGDRPDASGPAVAEFLASHGFDVAATAVVPDTQVLISEKIQQWADHGVARLIVTTGGTGLGPRDVTPEATRDTLDREAPGIAELMRREGGPRAALSRQVAGVRGASLIVNVPGSPEAAVECLEAVAGVLAHAIHAASGGGHEAGTP